MQLGAEVDVMMTAAAREFVAPLTFAAITHRPVAESLFDPRSELLIDHVAIAERADVVIIAPATAQTIAKLALGFADDPIGATVLATAAPVIVAPAMDANMYDSPATQANVDTLSSRGVTIAGPAEGRLASGLMGKGRLLETADLLGYVRLVLGRTGDLAGRKVVVSAGGTQEDIDPVRFVGNRSSGKMGYAIAEAAIDRGAETVIVAAPNALQAPVGARVVHVGSALEMRDAVLAECEGADAVVMAAAVADWRPAERAESKLKKGDRTSMTLELVRTPDIAAEIDGDGLVKVGFAAESDDLVANARAKIASKGLDLIAANDITAEGAGFGADTNRVTLIDREGNEEELGLMLKYDVGQCILDHVAALLGSGLLSCRGGVLTSQDTDQLIIRAIQDHYGEHETPYYLAELGKFFRSHNIEIPNGVRFKDYLIGRFHGRLSVIQDDDNPARIAISLPEHEPKVRQTTLWTDHRFF